MQLRFDPWDRWYTGPVPQRLQPYQQGERMAFVRYLGPVLHPSRIHWRQDADALTPSVWQRSGRSAPEGSGSILDAERPPKGLAVSPEGVRSVQVHDVPGGLLDRIRSLGRWPRGRARVTTVVGDRAVAHGEHPDTSADRPVLTDGATILVATAGDREGVTPLWAYRGWDLVQRDPWPIERLREALGPVLPIRVVDLRVDGPRVLVATEDTWSAWTWDGGLLEAWRLPERVSLGTLMAWRDGTAVLDLRAGMHAWDVRAGRGEPLAAPGGRGALTSDGRWLVVDRVPAGEQRHLELWDVGARQCVERLPIRRRAVRCISIAPDDTHVAIATKGDALLLRLEV